MNELLELFSLDIDAYMHGALLIGALVGIGVLMGFLAGLFGVGGAFLLNPFLIVLLGISETLAVGVSLSFVIGTGAAGTARHWRMNNVDFKTAIYLAVGALPCVLLGKLMHEGMRDALGLSLFGALFRLFYVLILLVTAWIVFRGPGRDKDVKPILQRLSSGPYIDLCGGKLKRISLVGLLLMGGCVGVLQGLLGIGGGVVLVPLLVAAVGLSMHLAVGTSLGVVVLCSIFGTVLYGQAGQVNLLLVMSLLVGSGVGVQGGAWLCQELKAHRLQRSFGWVVLLAVVLVAVDLVVKLVKI